MIIDEPVTQIVSTGTVDGRPSREDEDAKRVPTLLPTMADSYAGGLSECTGVSLSIWRAATDQLRSGVIIFSTYRARRKIDNHGGLLQSYIRVRGEIHDASGGRRLSWGLRRCGW